MKLKEDCKTKIKLIFLGCLLVVALAVGTMPAAIPALADGEASEPRQEVPKHWKVR